MPPELLAGRRRQGEHNLLLALPRVHENAIADHDGRGLTTADPHFPELVECRGQLCWKFGADRLTVAIRPAPLRPVGALGG